MSDIISKYYIYNSTNNYAGLISYEQDLQNKLDNGWIVTGEFYAINPYLKPIPDGMKVFSLEIKNYYPFDITSYKLLYDIYEVDNFKDQYHVNFITYNRPVLKSVPLYFYQLNNSILPSFKNVPPNSSYTLASGVNPIFVLKESNTKFFCDNGRCIPGPMPLHHFHPNMQYDDNLTFKDCLNKCRNQGTGILEIIDKMSVKNSNNHALDLNNTTNFLRNYLIFIGVIFISIILFLLYKK